MRLHAKHENCNAGIGNFLKHDDKVTLCGISSQPATADFFQPDQNDMPNMLNILFFSSSIETRVKKRSEKIHNNIPSVSYGLTRKSRVSNKAINLISIE